jgi:hypothetical protein
MTPLQEAALEQTIIGQKACFGHSHLRMVAHKKPTRNQRCFGRVIGSLLVIFAACSAFVMASW